MMLNSIFGLPLSPITSTVRHTNGPPVNVFVKTREDKLSEKPTQNTLSLFPHLTLKLAEANQSPQSLRDRNGLVARQKYSDYG